MGGEKYLNWGTIGIKSVFETPVRVQRQRANSLYAWEAMRLVTLLWTQTQNVHTIKTGTIETR